MLLLVFIIGEQTIGFAQFFSFKRRLVDFKALANSNIE
jgi:hypothetical protein